MAVLMRAATRPSAAGLRRRALAVAWTVLAWTIVSGFLSVFLWMVLTALKSQVDNTAMPPVWIFKPTLSNFEHVFASKSFGRFMLNSLIVGFGSTALGLLLGLPAAYSIARHRQRGLAMAILFARMAPFMSYLVPWFIMFRQFGLIDSYLGLTASHLVISLPLAVWLMIGFFEDIPQEIEEAAEIDGCSRPESFLYVALPIARNGIAATAVLSFIFSWNNFLFALILAGPTTRTVPVAVFSFLSYEQVDWGGLAAASTIITLPVLLFIFVIHKQIVRGLTFGAVKG
jgi:multiple sugar transport system permease protein